MQRGQWRLLSSWHVKRGKSLRSNRHASTHHFCQGRKPFAINPVSINQEHGVMPENSGFTCFKPVSFKRSLPAFSKINHRGAAAIHQGWQVIRQHCAAIPVIEEIEVTEFIHFHRVLGWRVAIIDFRPSLMQEGKRFNTGRPRFRRSCSITIWRTIFHWGGPLTHTTSTAPRPASIPALTSCGIDACSYEASNC